jgi:hypothetical protein
VRPHLLLAVALTSSLTAAAPVRPHSSSGDLCHAGETTWFSCATRRHKTISLCGQTPFLVQYRYGTPARVEFAFPQHPEEAPKALASAHYMRFQVERTEVTFRRLGVDYAVFDDTENGQRSAGVRVTAADGTEHQTTCKGPITGHLLTLARHLRCDPDNALNGGRCD